MNNSVDELDTPEMDALRHKFFELYGYSQGYHWNSFGSIEDYKNYLIAKIAEKEKELAGGE